MIIKSNLCSVHPRLEIAGNKLCLPGKAGVKIDFQQECWKSLVEHWNSLIEKNSNLEQCFGIPGRTIEIQRDIAGGRYSRSAGIELMRSEEIKRIQRHFPLHSVPEGLGGVTKAASRVASSTHCDFDFFVPLLQQSEIEGITEKPKTSPALAPNSFGLQFHTSYAQEPLQMLESYARDAIKLVDFASKFSFMLANDCKNDPMSFQPEVTMESVRPALSCLKSAGVTELVGVRGKGLDTFSDILKECGFSDAMGWSAVRVIAALLSAQSCLASTLTLPEIKFKGDERRFLANSITVPGNRLNDPRTELLSMVAARGMHSQAEVVGEFEIPVTYRGGEEGGIRSTLVSACLPMTLLTEGDTDLLESHHAEVFCVEPVESLSEARAEVQKGQKLEASLASLLKGRDYAKDN